MMSKTKSVVLAGIISLLVVATLSLGLWLMDWYWLTPWWKPTLQVLAILAFSGLAGWAIYWFLNRPKVDEEVKKREAWREKVIKNRFQHIARIHAKFSSNPYTIPWYVHVSQDIQSESLWLQQMGFETVESAEPVPEDLVALKFWVSDSAVLVSIDLNASEQTLKQSLHYFYDNLLELRPRQALNGVLAAVSLQSMLAQNESESVALGQQYRAFLAELNSKVGLSLPVYCIFTQMASVKDLCEVFATLDEAKREKPFGALRPVSTDLRYDKAWFDESFDDLLKRLSVTLSDTLKQQLNTDYRESSVAGIFQLAALKYDIEDFLSLAFSQHQYDDVILNLRGYFFINAGSVSSSTDLVTLTNASELGFQQLNIAKTPSSALSLFGSNLFRHCILKEAPIVGVHKTKEWRYRTGRWVLSTGLVVLFGLFGWLVKANFEYQQTLDARAFTLLEQFKDNLKNETIVRDDLSSPIFSLAELRDIEQVYATQKAPWYIVSWLPDSSIETNVRQAYFQELDIVLLNLMRDYILKDMFVYNTLDDKVKTLELLNYYQILFNPNRSDISSLVDYYIDALKEEGEGDTELLQRFKLLAMDTLRKGVVPETSDEELLALVRSSLSSEDIGDLLYQHIVQHERFAKRIDMREKLSPAFSKVFEFDAGFSGYLIPYLFTREGFEELNNQTGFELASEAIHSYEGVMGRISGEAEMSRINRQLRERYAQDYVRYWKDFTANVHWTSVSTWGDVSVQMAITTDMVFSPVKQFYTLVNDNTNLVVKKAPAKAATDPKAAETSSQSQVDAETKERVAGLISAPFSTFHKLVESSKDSQSPLDLSLGQIRKVSDWLDESKATLQRGDYFLEQLKNTDSSNPLAQLENSANDFSDKLLPFMMKGQARTINRLALEDMRSRINDDWTKVSEFYQQRFAGRYPFNKVASFDASLDDVQSFFVKGGVVDQFIANYQPFFETMGAGQTLLKGFIPQQYASLSDMYQPFLIKVEQVQKGLFIKDQLGAEFLLRAEKMSPQLTRFALESSGVLFEYQNGPFFWKQLSWPIPSNQQQNLSLVATDKANAIVREELSGPWNWFKLADKLNSSTVVGSEDVLWRYTVKDGQDVNLRVRANSVEQPFEPHFFSGLVPPVTL